MLKIRIIFILSLIIYFFSIINVLALEEEGTSNEVSNTKYDIIVFLPFQNIFNCCCFTLDDNVVYLSVSIASISFLR